MKYKSGLNLRMIAAAFTKLPCRGALAILLMSLAVLAVYWSPAVPDTMLIGSDYFQLHLRRMQFARDALFAPRPMLPGWYPRELLGTPFWSNIQNFPFIPTRLLVLLTMEPSGPYAYSIAVMLSALLAALFTYLYLRKVGLGMTGSAAAGWTFACSGYYASRVAAGHLPLLEAYPALPLLLWVVESLARAQERGEPLRRWIGTAAISSTCVMLAGHPQLPIYAMSAAGLYALWRQGLRRALWMCGAMALGVGVAGFSLAPMLMLIARSTRVLALAPPFNDLSMPYARLLAFFLPWRDGAPPLLDPEAIQRFHGYPNLAYFWDTVSYIGVLPWIVVVLLCGCIAWSKLDDASKKIMPYVAVSGVLGIILALPFIHQVTSLIPGTILRSPARAIYLTEFALAIALGIGVHLAGVMGQTRIAGVVIALLLITHAVDLGSHSRRFILRGSFHLPAAESEILARTLKKVGDGRVAIDYALTLPVNRKFDDIGFFDSIMLARPYRTILSLADAPPNLNIQTFNGSELSSRALAITGVRLVITTVERKDLQIEDRVYGSKIYLVPSVSPRAQFFEVDRVQYLESDRIDSMLRDPEFDLSSNLLLPAEAVETAPRGVGGTISGFPTIACRRPDSDRIECSVTTGRNGYLRMIESWDPGWSVTVDGLTAPIVPAMNALLAVPMTPGRHQVRFVYQTPGAALGQAISIISLVILAGLVWISEKKRPL